MQKSLLALFVCAPIAAVAQQPAFDVASIKPSNYQGGPLRVIPAIGADGIDFVNVTPRLCIQRAYGLKPYQLSGPEWINTERYMIAAKAAGPTAQDRILLMLRTLLAERFKLAFHHEQKEMPVYALVVAKNGSKLKEATDEGATRIDSEGTETVFERVSIGGLVAVVGRSVDRPVIDATGLKGLYSFRLAWADDSRATVATGGPDDAPSIFAALQERLGLKLEPRTAPVDVLAIDHIEKPSGN
jgi:uncharacterized protein (TIGR03435 family)